MATITTTTAPRLRLGRSANGVLLTPQQFDAARFDRRWRYELVNGVLIVSPAPSRSERDPNEELGYYLRKYHDDDPQGAALDLTLAEETLETGANRRRADRVIWAGLGRLPREGEPPTIAVEFVSKGKRNFERDYEQKRDEYRAIKVQEYWIIDRFAATMTVHFLQQTGPDAKTVFRAGDVYTTPLLPGFQLPLKRLFDLADRWTRRGSP